MLHNTRFHPGSLVISALLVMSALLFGCSATKEAATKTAEMLRQNTVLQKKNSQLAAKLAEQNAVTARLQMELFEKQAEINRSKSTQDDLSREAVHNKVRLRIPSPNTKVEAVTYLAEVETDINAAKELATDKEQPVFVQVDQYIAESKTELERGNYDKVCSLASQAMELTRSMRSKTALATMVKKSVYADFIAPLHLQVARRSNLRKKPGVRGKLIETLAAKSTVTATGYQGNWIKVTSKNGQVGWIHYSLLAVPETTLPFPKPVT